MHIENRLSLRRLAVPLRRRDPIGSAKNGYIQTLAALKTASRHLTTPNQFTLSQKVSYLFEQGGSCVRLPWGSR